MNLNPNGAFWHDREPGAAGAGGPRFVDEAEAGNTTGCSVSPAK
jgi:hypothetical protein